MADDTKAAPSTAPSGAPTAIMSTNAAAENMRDESGDQSVSVRALKTFHKHGDMTGEVVTPESEAFDVPRTRAAQLRANGLVEYVRQEDAVAIHGEIDAKRLDQKARLQAENSKLPANSKATPLRHPEVKLAGL